jgi:membrane protease YdiL (CAAX protease family)
MKLSTQKKHLLFALSSWLIVIILMRLIEQIRSIPFLTQNASTINAALLLYVPILIALWKKERITYWDLSGKAILSALKYFTIVSLMIFPAAFVANHFYQTLILGAHYHAAHPQAVGFSATWLLAQTILVALPEEFFFRGFLNNALENVLPPTRRLFGAPFGLSVVIVSLIFAFSHSIIHLAWWHGLIFFPALVFAWLRQKTGAIWASILFHVACNCFSFWTFLHYS